MARNYARTPVDIWSRFNDSNLSPNEKFTYLTITAQKQVTACGALIINTRKWSRDSGLSVNEIEESLEGLAAAGWLFVDDDTGELAIANFATDDVQRSNWKMIKGFWAALDRIESSQLRNDILVSLPDWFMTPTEIDARRKNKKSAAQEPATDRPIEPTTEPVIDRPTEPPIEPPTDRAIQPDLLAKPPETDPERSMERPIGPAIDRSRNPEPGSRNPEPGKQSSSSPDLLQQQPVDNRRDDDEHPDSAQLIEQVAEILGVHDFKQSKARGTLVRNPTRYRARCITEREWDPEVRHTCTQAPPGTTARTIADQILQTEQGHTTQPKSNPNHLPGTGHLTDNSNFHDRWEETPHGMKPRQATA